MKRSFSGASDLSLLLDDYLEHGLLGSLETSLFPSAQGNVKEQFFAGQSLCESFFDPTCGLQPLEGMQYEGFLLSSQSFSPPQTLSCLSARDAPDNAVHLASDMFKVEDGYSRPTSYGSHQQGTPAFTLPQVTSQSWSAASPVQLDIARQSSETLSTHSPSPKTQPIPGKRGRGRTCHTNPSASTLAQRRYHERQKAKKAEENRQMQDLQSQMERLMYEKRVLESKQEMLVKECVTWQSHVETLWNTEAVRLKSQIATLKLTADLIGRVSHTCIDLETAKQWTVQEFVYEHYQRLIDRERQLCDSILTSTTHTFDEIEELESLWDLQESIEIRGGLGSSLHLSMWAYNQRETELRRVSLPSPNLWESILDDLRLSADQVEMILSCYEWMHRSIVGVMKERELNILPQLQMEATFLPRGRAHCCPGAGRLYKSLRTEQTTVLGFLMQIEKVLSKVQKAFVECKSYPWCADWMQMCKLLQQRHGRKPLRFPDVAHQGSDLDIFPKASAFQALTTPMTALGMGSRFRIGVTICPFETVMSRLCFPSPPLERMGRTKLLDAMMGRWRRYSCWQWMQKVKEVGYLIENDLVDLENGDSDNSHDWQ